MRPISAILCLSVVFSSIFSGCAVTQVPMANGIQVDQALCEVRLDAVVQKTDAPRMNDFGQAVPALLGSQGGDFEESFVFVTDAWVQEIHDGLRALGATPRVVYPLAEVPAHKGLRPDNTAADYMQGDPVQIIIQWRDGGKTLRRAYEDFFEEKIVVGPAATIKPWTPHFVFHGSAILNKRTTGCIACTHDCPGGIIGNNEFPLVEPIPVLRANWDKLPAPGTRVTVVLRPVPSEAF